MCFINRKLNVYSAFLSGRQSFESVYLLPFVQKPKVNHSKAIKEYSGSAADKVHNMKFIGCVLAVHSMHTLC